MGVPWAMSRGCGVSRVSNSRSAGVNRPPTAAAARWVQGDFNDSNGVTLTDITLLNNTGLYSQGSSLPAAPAGQLSLTRLRMRGSTSRATDCYRCAPNAGNISS